MKRDLLVAMSFLLLGFGSLGMAEASEPVYWKSLSTSYVPSQIEPESINVSSGTGSGTFSVFGLDDWLGWGSKTAYATGIARVKDCLPSCAGGGFKDRPARVKLSAIRSICGERRYMNIEIRVFDQPKAWTFGPWGSDCRGAQILRPYGVPTPKPRPRPKPRLGRNEARLAMKKTLRTNFTYWNGGFSRRISCRRRSMNEYSCTASWLHLVTSNGGTFRIYGRARARIVKTKQWGIRLRGRAIYGPKPDPNGFTQNVSLNEIF